MFAINHAATGLIIKKIYPDVPMTVILVSVQLIEIFWVILNFSGIEKTRTNDEVRTVKDVELAYMPFSHSIASTAVLALGAWALIALGLRRLDLGAAIALGIGSHLVLDLISHARDIALAPFRGGAGSSAWGCTRDRQLLCVRNGLRYTLLVDLRGQQYAAGDHCSFQYGECIVVPEINPGTGEVPCASTKVDNGRGCRANYRNGVSGRDI